MRNRLLMLVALPALLFWAFSSVVAVAAVPTPVVHVQLSPETQADALFLVSADFPEGVPLPIPVTLAVPKGARVSWAGEIFGGDVSKDIAAQHKTTPRKGYDEVSFTLTKSHAAQVEANWHAIKSNGSQSEISLAWVQSFPARTVDFGFKAPTQDSVVKMTPPWKKVGRDADNIPFYVTQPVVPQLGKTIDVKISYTGQPSSSGRSGEQTAQGSASGSGPSPNLAIGIFVVIVGGGAIAATIFSQLKKGN